MKDPLSPTSFNSLERVATYHTANTVVTSSDMPVPRAAPATPMSNPYMNIQLKTTSSTHMPMYIMLGTFMLPLACRQALAAHPTAPIGMNAE